MGGAAGNPAVSPQIANSTNPAVQQIMHATVANNNTGNDLAKRMFFGQQQQPVQQPARPMAPIVARSGTLSSGWY